MPYPINILPDAELAVIQYLRARSEVTSLVPASRITTALPSSATYPYITVTRAGGNALQAWAIDQPSLQIDVWGGLKEDCYAVAAAIRACIVAIRNDQVSEATLVSGFEELGPQWMPDMVTTPPLSRYVARYQVVLHK